MITCEECSELLSQYENQELEQEIQKQVEIHLLSCKACQEERKLLQEIIHTSQNLPAPALSLMASLKIKKSLNEVMEIEESRPHQFPPIMNMEDLSCYVKIPREELEEMLHDIPHFFIGQHIRFRKERIDSWIEKLEQNQYAEHMSFKLKLG